MTENFRVDPADVTLGELIDIETVLGCSIADSSGTAVTAGFAWVIRRRSDPTFTYADALTFRPGDLDVVTPESPGEAPGGDNGLSPPTFARTWQLNPADVMTLPTGLLEAMGSVIHDEVRAARRAQRRHG